jgi:hypothetical protein
MFGHPPCSEDPHEASARSPVLVRYQNVNDIRDRHPHGHPGKCRRARDDASLACVQDSGRFSLACREARIVHEVDAGQHRSPRPSGSDSAAKRRVVIPADKACGLVIKSHCRRHISTTRLST